MKKIIEDGFGFVKQEMNRITNIIKAGKASEKKLQELTHRLNILRTFSLAQKDEKVEL